MKLLFDLHTHTVASGHAFSTLKENIEEAAAKGLKAMGTSDHYSAMPGSAQPIYFTNFKAIKEKILGVRIFTGMEANIIDLEGKLDAEEAVLKKMDYVIASLHVPCVKAGTREENTNALIGAMKNPYVKIIGHPDDSRFPIDYDTLTAAAREHHKLLEVNNSSLTPLSYRQGVRENYVKMLELCRHYRTPVIVNSDAHCEADSGNHASAYALLEELDFPQELVVNTSIELLSAYLNAILAQPEGARCGQLPRDTGAPRPQLLQEGPSDD